MVWQGHILSSDIGLVFGLVLIGHWAGFGLVLIGHWAGFVTQTWQPCCHLRIFFSSRLLILRLLLLSPPSFHAIILLHLLHVTMFESFCAKYSHTFDRLAFGIFSVKRLMASSVCACSVKCCLLFTVIRLLL